MRFSCLDRPHPVITGIMAGQTLQELIAEAKNAEFDGAQVERRNGRRSGAKTQWATRSVGARIPPLPPPDGCGEKACDLPLCFLTDGLIRAVTRF
jgi:hypothetical protein